MKHLFRAAMVLLLTAGLASAAAIADNDQLEFQFDGGISGAGGGVAGQIGGAAGFQIGGGFSSADPGDAAGESQSQTQQQSDFTAASDGLGNFAGSAWQTDQNQESFSGASGGIAGNGQVQGLVGGSAGLSLGGQFGVAGSAGAALGASGSFALGGAITANEQDQTFNGQYEQQSVGPNSYVYQTGEQEFGTETGSGALIVGAGFGVAGVTQYGGTVAANDGQAGFMVGGGHAEGDAFAASGGIGLAGGSGSAYGEQSHTYLQEAATPTAYQMQTGTVTTFVQATSP